MKQHSHSLSKGNRSARIGDQIQKDLAQILQARFKDERLKGTLVTITAVEMAPDYSAAKVFYSFIGAAAQPQVQIALDAGKGFLRRELGAGLMLRLTPELSFHFDNSITQGAAMNELIAQALQTQAKE